MVFKLVVSDDVTIRVSGSLPDERGTPQRFDFSLLAKRLDTAELRETLSSEDLIEDWLQPRVHGWSQVLDEQGQSLPFSPEHLRQLLRIVGMPALIYAAYVQASGARGKEKN